LLHKEGKALAASRDAKFIETSSGIQHNVDELLVGILKQVSRGGRVDVNDMGVMEGGKVESWGCGYRGKVRTTRNPPMHGEMVQEMELNGFATQLGDGQVFGLGYGLAGPASGSGH